MKHRTLNILIIYLAVLGSSLLWWTGAQSQDRPDLVVQSGHTSSVGSLAFSPDGRYIASGSRDRTVKVWDVDSGMELRTFARHNGLVKTVAFSPNGRFVASGGQDKIIRLWDITTGREVRTFKGHINDKVHLILTRRWFAGLDQFRNLFEKGAKRYNGKTVGHRNRKGSADVYRSYQKR